MKFNRVNLKAQRPSRYMIVVPCQYIADLIDEVERDVIRIGVEKQDVLFLLGRYDNDGCHIIETEEYTFYIISNINPESQLQYIAQHEDVRINVLEDMMQLREIA